MSPSYSQLRGKLEYARRYLADLHDEALALYGYDAARPGSASVEMEISGAIDDVEAALRACPREDC